MQEQQDNKLRDVNLKHQWPYSAELRQPHYLKAWTDVEDVPGNILDHPDYQQAGQEGEKDFQPPYHLGLGCGGLFRLANLTEQEQTSIDQEENQSGDKVKDEEAKSLDVGELAHVRPDETEFFTQSPLRDAFKNDRIPKRITQQESLADDLSINYS